MSTGEVILRFNQVSFGYDPRKPILSEADFSLREGMKVTLMGQNGAGKSTIFSLICGASEPESGAITTKDGLTIAHARQAVQPKEFKLTIREYFEKLFTRKIYDIDKHIARVFDVVRLGVSPDRLVGDLSGGQQARMLLASALIQDADLLLLDEPTNNLDAEGLKHLTVFLKEYSKTCIVISHDADFLNAFTHGVLYLDIFTHRVEQYAGDYFKVVREIEARLERERRENVRLQKDIQHRKEQANFFAQKGGHMRDVARKMYEKIEELSEAIIEERREDKTIRRFTIPCEQGIGAELLGITSVSVIVNGKPVNKKTNISLRKKMRLLVTGPNGIGKSTLLHGIASGTAAGVRVASGIRLGYYHQNFSQLDMDASAYQTLAEVMRPLSEERLRSVAAGFLLDAEVLRSKVGSLSEGQKGLLSFARLVLMEPGLLVLDEPTNHINFRHLPVIAEALEAYEGAMILVSHIPEFVQKIRINETLDLSLL